LIHVEQIGVACHTGQKSCFYRELDDAQIKGLNYSYAFEENAKEKILDELYGLLEERITNKVEGSYTYSLHKKGLDEIIKKLGEEAIEVIIAAKHQDKKALVYEIADLLYHLDCLNGGKENNHRRVEEELKKRRKKSTSSNDH
jgi:phosphoribosyl-AMP cyclohydrolase / phosphoribosyl-ATP pyrophosphohydrolase